MTTERPQHPFFHKPGEGFAGTANNAAGGFLGILDPNQLIEGHPNPTIHPLGRRHPVAQVGEAEYRLGGHDVRVRGGLGQHQQGFGELVACGGKEAVFGALGHQPKVFVQHRGNLAGHLGNICDQNPIAFTLRYLMMWLEVIFYRRSLSISFSIG